MEPNRLLDRQLRRLGLSKETPPEGKAWEALLDVIATAYRQFDEDRYLLERSLELSSREINERIKKDKEQSIKLAHAGKLASLGTLASGVAHELNNPLTIIKGFVELCASGNPKVPVEATLRKALRQIARMASIIGHLRRLSRQTGDQDVKKLDPERPIIESIELLKTKFLSENIKITLTHRGTRCFISGDDVRLESIYQNLLINTFDAFCTSKSPHNNRLVSIVVNYQDGDSIQVEYRDNAGGMPASIIEKVFDPFFTTKEVGKGTGLGLSICRQVMQEHGGDMSVSSQEGVGTTFILSFPVYKEDSEKIIVHAIAESPVGLEHWKEMSQVILPSILVVDDEVEIAEILDTVLSQKFRTTTANSALEAEKLLKANQYDLLMTDIRMPVMSGCELAAKAILAQPKIALVMMSGHAIAELTPELTPLGDYLFLKKPFDDLQILLGEVESFYDQFKQTQKIVA